MEASMTNGIARPPTVRKVYITISSSNESFLGCSMLYGNKITFDGVGQERSLQLQHFRMRSVLHVSMPSISFILLAPITSCYSTYLNLSSIGSLRREAPPS